MKHCILYPNLVEFEVRNITNTPKAREKAIIAQQTIEQLVKEPSSIVYDKEDPSGVASHFQPGEEVTLCGAYLGMSLYSAGTALKEKGIKVSYHPEGCI